MLNTISANIVHPPFDPQHGMHTNWQDVTSNSPTQFQAQYVTDAEMRTDNQKTLRNITKKVCFKVRVLILVISIFLWPYMFHDHIKPYMAKPALLPNQSFPKAFGEFWYPTPITTPDVVWSQLVMEPENILPVLFMIWDWYSVTLRFEAYGNELDKMFVQMLWFVSIGLLWLVVDTYKDGYAIWSVHINWFTGPAACGIVTMRMYFYACYPGKCDIMPIPFMRARKPVSAI